MNFDAFVKDITDNKWNVFGTEVYVDGVLKHSWGDTSGLHDIYSATKSVLSIAFGILYDEGKIDPDRPFVEYLPEEASYSEKYKEVTVRRLLTMDVPGLPFRAEGDNWLEYSLNCDIDPDVVTFNYSNINSFLIGVCLTNILGSDLGAFIEERIFKPLDISSYEYGRSPEGYFYGASGMRLSVHDLSKFGLLMLNKGVYNGVRIVSEEYVEMATSIQKMNREGGYGFFFWKYRGGFSINGKCKQKCYVLPKQGLVITYLSYIDDDSHDLVESAEKNIIGTDKDAEARIAAMEKLYDLALTKEATSAEIKTLEEYYTGADWKHDLALDETGLLPANLKRGVLSEDGLYDLLEDMI